MDSFSHAAWGATIVRKSQYLWWAAVVGALPDILLMLYGLIRFGRKYIDEYSGQRFISGENDPYVSVYRYLHSLVPVTVVGVLLYLVARQYCILIAPYYLHVLVDSFVHSGIWAIRPFYPLSNWNFQGYDWWKNKWITIGNWLILVLVNVILIYVV